jgi:excisionase family DNA binding protein
MTSANWRQEIYTVKEAAMLLHVSTPTVYRMIRDGILIPSTVAIRSGRRQLAIPRSEVEHYIDALKTSARRLQNV